MPVRLVIILVILIAIVKIERMFLVYFILRSYRPTGFLHRPSFVHILIQFAGGIRRERRLSEIPCHLQT